ncbi:uncharacterized protein LOC134574530 [Pelobates fuscus]|uniref:uncharacterized protein LOC134574530 n=1 Tax=Pelobates fuscus TaxID=191477 RepID=UPI002FE43E46
MPKCIIKKCQSKTGQKDTNPEVTLHVFPKNLERIKQWLEATGQTFQDLDAISKVVLDDSFRNNYRLCSKHFAASCYVPKGGKIILRDDVVPTIFETGGKEQVDEIIFYRPAKKLRREKEKQLEQMNAAAASGLIRICVEASTSTDDLVETRDFGTQTDSPFALCVSTQCPEVQYTVADKCALERDHSYSKKMSYTETSESDSEMSFTSTPTKASGPTVSGVLNNQHQVVSEDGTCLSLKDLPLEFVFELHDGTPLQTGPSVICNTDGMKENINEPDSAMDFTVSSFHKPVAMSKEKKMINERKFVVFESCLDDLLLKMSCASKMKCNAPVKRTLKKVEGTFLSVTGYCSKGHKFPLWQSQPRLSKFAVGNLLFSASVLFSGSNFRKVEEMSNILGLQIISESAYRGFQNKHLYKTIYHHWQIEQGNLRKEMRPRLLCLRSDRHSNSTGHAAMFCNYTLMDSATKKIVDFQTVQLSKGASSATMEQDAFQLCLDRVLDNDYEVHIMASDKDDGIKTLMTEKYPDISHQYDVWHCANSLRNKLLAASQKENCKDLVDWVTPVIKHFWWCIQTCDCNIESLRERWDSVLYHVIDQHTWEGTSLYHACSHETIREKEKKKIKWLKKASPAFFQLHDIVRDAQLQKDLNSLTMYCHSDAIDAFHSLMLKYRTKWVHSGLDSAEAQTALAVLAHNFNVDRKQAVEEVPYRGSEPVSMLRTRLEDLRSRKRWIVHFVNEPMSNAHVEDMLHSLLLISSGKLQTSWFSKSSLLTPNIMEGPREEKHISGIKRKS